MVMGEQLEGEAVEESESCLRRQREKNKWWRGISCVLNEC